MAPPALRLIIPDTENGTVVSGGITAGTNRPPLQRKNGAVRSHEHLTPAEVEKLIDVARDNRWGQRDATAILLAFRHGLRVSELCSLIPVVLFPDSVIGWVSCGFIT